MRKLYLGIIVFFLLVACVPATRVSVATETPTPRPRRLLPGELQLAASPGDIPAIFASDDLFVGNESNEWPDDEEVVGVEINGDARAYPLRLLSLHEIVNDVIGGQPVAVTWCPLCYSALVFERVVDGTELTFGVSGYLYRNNLVMYDHQSNGLWSQLLAQGIKGSYRGAYLTVYPSVLTTWEQWEQAHPQARILSAERLGRDTASIVDPYSGYYLSGSAGLGGQGNLDERLPAKALVIGLLENGAARAYALADVQALGTLEDAPFVLVYDETLNTVIVQRRGADGSLSRVVSPLVFWFAWSDIHPETTLYASP